MNNYYYLLRNINGKLIKVVYVTPCNDEIVVATIDDSEPVNPAITFLNPIGINGVMKIAKLLETL